MSGWTNINVSSKTGISTVAQLDVIKFETFDIIRFTVYPSGSTTNTSIMMSNYSSTTGYAVKGWNTGTGYIDCLITGSQIRFDLVAANTNGVAGCIIVPR
jgi:hypothetical protein